MKEIFGRTELLLGSKSMEKIYNSRVAVFGVGGVGGHIIEALARCGVGHIDIIDDDSVCASNINRQVIALHSTVGRAKVDVMEEHIHDICPDTKVSKYRVFVGSENIDDFPWEDYDYVADAVDTVSAKLLIVQKAVQHQIPVISCMGVGNKLHPEMLEITDLFKTSMCPLAKVMRKECKARGIYKLKVLYSKEQPLKHHEEADEKCAQDAGIGEDTNRGDKGGKRYTPGSISFVPSAAGLMIGGEIIRNIVGVK